VRRLLRRDRLDGALDWVRYKLDSATLPRRWCQPLPSLGLSSDKGVESRWTAMLPLLDELQPETAVDVGSNVGWFPLKLGERGIPTIGIEGAAPLYRISLYAVHRSGAKNVGVLALWVTPETARLLPAGDCVLVLAVWHHLVRDFGLEEATAILRTIWEKTGRVLFFDTGEAEMPPEFALPPLEPDARTWLEDYLQTTCAGGRVEHLGLHEARAPDGTPVERNLFAVVREAA
jgi:hypothetical protein